MTDTQGALLGPEKGWNSDTYYKMDETQEHSAK